MPDDNTNSSSDRLETAVRRFLTVVGKLEVELHRLVEIVENQRSRIAELEAELSRTRQSGGQ